MYYFFRWKCCIHSNYLIIIWPVLWVESTALIIMKPSNYCIMANTQNEGWSKPSQYMFEHLPQGQKIHNEINLFICSWISNDAIIFI